MSSKKWLVTFFLSVILIFALLAGMNALVDPFGVFGDVIYHWYSYSETMNPRIAKIEYLDEHHSQYDSYIIGCSSTSSFPVEELNRYYGADFYNMIMYGADMKDVEKTVAYMLKNYTVKNLVLNVYIDNGVFYDVNEDTITNNLHEKVSGASRLSFYSKYLFLNPQYAISKIKAAVNDTYIPQPFDVFDVKTGSYDKRARDAEPIGSMSDYISAYPVFSDYPEASMSLTQIENCVSSVAAIRDMCKKAGVNFEVVCAPVYSEYMAYFSREQVSDFYTKLAEVTPYWDFSMSSVSYEPRYFYDGTHFRNCAGKMALARMFNDESVYIPEDYGKYITSKNVSVHMSSFWDKPSIDIDSYTAEVPILMYHHLDEAGNDTTNISAGTFEEQIKALNDSGFTAITFDELISYVNGYKALPEKPVLITFDDGYLSNYELAYPILQKYGMKATIFVIGSSVGKDLYKDTENKITPHFDYIQAKEMADSGLISIQSHTYDMHQWQPYESGEARTNILRLKAEDEKAYIAALKADFIKSSSEISSATGQPVNVLAYPYGAYDTLAQAVLNEMDVKVTLSTAPGCNTVVKGLPQSLYGMRRFNINEAIAVSELLNMVSSARG